MNIDIIVIIVMVVLVILSIVLIMIMVLDISDTLIYNRKRKKLDIALENALKTYFKQKEYKNVIGEIRVIYNDVVATNERLKSEMPNIVVLLENHVLRINTEDIFWVNGEIDVDIYKKNVQLLIEEYNKKNPLEQIKGTDYAVLKQLLEHLEKAEVESGKEVINSIAVEMKRLQDNILEKEKNGRRQDAMTKVSIACQLFLDL